MSPTSATSTLASSNARSSPILANYSEPEAETAPIRPKGPARSVIQDFEGLALAVYGSRLPLSTRTGTFLAMVVPSPSWPKSLALHRRIGLRRRQADLIEGDRDDGVDDQLFYSGDLRRIPRTRLEHARQVLTTSAFPA